MVHATEVLERLLRDVQVVIKPVTCVTPVTVKALGAAESVGGLSL